MRSVWASWSPTESHGAGWANKQFKRPSAPHSHFQLSLANASVIFIWGLVFLSRCLWALKLQLFFERAFVMYNNHLPTHQVRTTGWEAVCDPKTACWDRRAQSISYSARKSSCAFAFHLMTDFIACCLYSMCFCSIILVITWKTKLDLNRLNYCKTSNITLWTAALWTLREAAIDRKREQN